jgi:PAS domain S-box-containing protein
MLERLLNLLFIRRVRAWEKRVGDLEASYESLIESLPLSAFRKDLDGRLISANRRFCEAIGRKLEDILGNTDADLFPEKFARKYREDDRRVMATGQVVEDIEENVKPDGTLSYVHVWKAPVRDAKGRIVGVQGLFSDETARHRAEMALRTAKDAAEAASRAKSIFLANMSHEIRTPMNGILGMTELLLDTPLSPDQREYLRLVRDSGESLLTVINDVLDFSKIEVGKLVLERAVFSLRDSLGDAVKSLAFRAHVKGLELAYEVAPDIPQMLEGDRNRLRQIVVNLVGNAIKFTERGEVLVTVRQQSESAHGVELLFAVSDTGIGIQPEKLERIFDAFEQADNSASRKFGGTGLGLAIASNLVELMGGRIWAESQANQGTVMRFTARFERHDGEALEHTMAGTVPLRDTRVLIVDDNPTSRRVLTEMVRNWDIEPTSVCGTDDALTAIDEACQAGRPFGLVLTDAYMPTTDGFALVERIQQNQHWNPAIIMMLDTTDRFRDTARCDQLGVKAFLMKPIKPSELLDSMMCALGIRSLAEEEELDERELPRLRPLNILLAEDSPVNQKLAIGLLSKHGHQVTVVENGREAVWRSRAQPFDLILMDVQMPEMDGLEATGAIRARERQVGGHIPIIAITAHAMKGDRELCIEAGMDDYISKPIRPSALYDTLAKVLASSGPNQHDAQAKGDRMNDNTLVDWSVARETCQGDETLLREIVSTFLEEAPRMVDSIRIATRAGDAKTVHRAAHTLKGALGHLGAKQAYDLALALETMGRQGDLAEAAGALGSLDRAMAKLTPVLVDYVDRSGAKRCP